MEEYNLTSGVSIKVGHKIEDKKEFSIVREYIIARGCNPKNFDENLKSLILDEDTTFYDYLRTVEEKDPKYNPIFNKISGKAEGVNFIHELFHMASTRYIGVDESGVLYKSGLGESLNEGITEYLTIEATKTKSVVYPLEVLFFEFLNQMYPQINGKALDAYFSGNPDLFYNLFEEDKDLVLNAVSYLDIYTTQRKKNYTGKGMDMSVNEVYEALTDAFSVILNRFMEKDEDYANELIDDFVDTMYDINELNQGNAMLAVNMLDGKINRGKLK